MENETKICNKCKNTLSISEFNKDSSRKDGLSSRCRACKSIDRNNYWKKTQKDPELKQKETVRRRAAFKKWRESGKQKAYRESSPERWFADRISTIKRAAIRRKIDFHIKHEMLVSLWYAQNGQCAITKLPMLLKYNSLYTASVDRIDSEKAYDINNIQLVCKAINLAKSDHTTQEVIDFISALKAESR